MPICTFQRLYEARILIANVTGLFRVQNGALSSGLIRITGRLAKYAADNFRVGQKGSDVCLYPLV